jgi:DNA invertase Pin-like site-specific DNA recombinase
MKTKSVYDIPMRVTFYARVSSDKDEQLNSLDNQISYYKDFIQNNRNWTYIEGFIDEGLSGISTVKRENFHKMINDAKLGLFDLVITKEISRFARNTLDSIQFTRELLSHGVGVFFQNDNINTLDEDSELRLTIMSGIAQDELRKLSSRVKFGHQQAIKNSVVLGNSRMFGYKKQNKKLVIDESEASMVRELFDLYSTNNYSMKQIEDIFWNKGYRNHNGNRISHSTMSNTISNPKYKGFYVGNKVKIVDMFTKKQKFLPPEDWVMFKDETGQIVPAIVSEELWDRANDILQTRSKDVKQRQNKCNHYNLLTGKLFCTDCGKAYYRRDSKDKFGNINSRWVCSGKINNGASSCSSASIYEEEIKKILYDVFCETSFEANKWVDEYYEMYNNIEDNNNLTKSISNLQNKIDVVLKKKNKLLEYNVTGRLSDDEFIKMNQQCAEEIKQYEIEIREMQDQMCSREDFKKHLNTIRKLLSVASQGTSQKIIDKAFIDQYIDKIYVTPDIDCMKLEVKIFTGIITEKYMERPNVRSGHTFKKMIQSYEQGMK